MKIYQIWTPYYGVKETTSKMVQPKSIYIQVCQKRMKLIKTYQNKLFAQYTDFNVKNFLNQTNKIQIEFMKLTFRRRMAFQMPFPPLR